jgi:hypothetical protein
MSKALLSTLRREALRVELPRVATLLRQRRAGEIDAGMIDELVDLFWLEWFGGSLQLTATGANICRQQIPK